MQWKKFRDQMKSFYPQKIDLYVIFKRLGETNDIILYPSKS